MLEIEQVAASKLF